MDITELAIVVNMDMITSLAMEMISVISGCTPRMGGHENFCKITKESTEKRAFSHSPQGNKRTEFTEIF